MTIGSKTRAHAAFLEDATYARVIPQIQFRETDNMRWLRERAPAWAEIAKITAAEAANPELDA